MNLLCMRILIENKTSQKQLKATTAFGTFLQLA